jgi:hypothetical protein
LYQLWYLVLAPLDVPSEITHGNNNIVARLTKS